MKKKKLTLSTKQAAGLPAEDLIIKIHAHLYATRKLAKTLHIDIVSTQFTWCLIACQLKWQGSILSTILVAVEFMSFEDRRIFKFCGTMIVIRWSGVTGIEEKNR